MMCFLLNGLSGYKSYIEQPFKIPEVIVFNKNGSVRIVCQSISSNHPLPASG